MVLKHLMLLLGLAVAPAWGNAWADVPFGPSPSTALGQTWEAWKAKLPHWTDYTPGGAVLKNMGRAQDNAGIYWQKAKNLRAFDRYCGHGAPFTQQPFCMAMQPSVREKPSHFFQRSPMVVLLDSLITRAGTATQPARDAATLLWSIRTLLEYPEREPSHPDKLVGLLYAQFGNCVPNTCQVAITRPSGFNEVMRGVILYFEAHGGETDISAAKLLRRAGF